ncbi:MAG: aspartate aminotransferase, partial [Pseudomonadota bacterium]
MQQPERFSDLPEYAFPRLRALLDPVPPGGETIPMSLGEPRHTIPDVMVETLAKHTILYGRYPPNDGAPELLNAISGWLRRRYGLSAERADPADRIFPLNGTREGLFAACVALVPER